MSGGWLRPAVFGAMDGLVTNVSLIAGVGGGGVSAHTIVLTGLAGLAAGPARWRPGSTCPSPRRTSSSWPRSTRNASSSSITPGPSRPSWPPCCGPGASAPATAKQAAAEISEYPEKALAVHALEELGVDPGELPSPVVAAGASLASFALGAVIPLFPYLIGLNVLAVALGLAAVAAVAGGGMVARLTDRPFWRGAVRQLVLGAAAAAITYGIGVAVGHVAA